MEDWRKTVRGVTMTTDQFDGIILKRDNIVKRAGYRSAQDQIMELTRAGQRLQQAREEQYAKPTGLMPRHYGEIDITVAEEKQEAIKEGIRTRLEQRRQEAAAQETATQEETKPEEPPQSQGGVT